jgi:hypothetical protein
MASLPAGNRPGRRCAVPPPGDPGRHSPWATCVPVTGSPGLAPRTRVQLGLIRKRRHRATVGLRRLWVRASSCLQSPLSLRRLDAGLAVLPPMSDFL